MKKLFFLIGVLITVPPLTGLCQTLLNEQGSFVVAKAVKIGRGKTSSFNNMNTLNANTELLKNCDPDCVSGFCDRNNGICSRCPAGKFIYNNKCLSCPANATCNDGVSFICKTGYYKSGIQCLPCTDINDKCTSCSNGSTCLSCQQDYILKNNICYVKKECSEYCEDCDYTTGKCLQCDSTSELQSDGTCKLLCPTTDMCVEEFGGKESDWTISNCECTSNKKYIMMYDQSISYAGKTLYRIKAMQDIAFKYDSVSLSVKKGDLGGYIEKESNLSTSKSDKGWVGGTAKVYGDGKVSGAWVTDQAVVSGGSVSYGAYIYENAKITGGSVSNAEVFGSATVSAGSTSSHAQIYGNAQQNGCLMSGGKLYGNAIVTGCEIHENVQVYGNARIYGQDVRLWGNVKVYDSAKIKSTSQIYIDGTVSIYGNAQVYGTKNWNASPGYQHQKLTGNELNIGGTVKFCDNSKKSGTYTSGTYYSSWEGSCKPSY